MPVDEELAKVKPAKDTLLTIGVFDGVHIGHKRLLGELTRRAREQSVLSGVITFKHHPQDVLTPPQTIPLLTDLEQRIELIRNEGVDFIVPLPFTPQVAAMSARRFLEILKKRLRMRGLVIGPDFALGQGRQGNAEAIAKLGREMGFSVTPVPATVIDGETVSSTAVRNALKKGEIDRVYKLTGRPFVIKGGVISGAGRGAGLGFPTANIAPDTNHALPKDGVYAGWCHIDDSRYQTLVNIGIQPTFSGEKRLVEVYILGYNGNLRGRELAVEPVARLRDERRFKDAEALKKQIAKDVTEGRQVLASKGVETKDGR